MKFEEFKAGVIKDTTDLLDSLWFDTEHEYSTYLNGVETAAWVLGYENKQVYGLTDTLVELGKNSKQKIYTDNYYTLKDYKQENGGK